MEIKKCTKCGKEYPKTLEYFTKTKKNKDGLDYWCKECKKEYKRQHKPQRESIIHKQPKVLSEEEKEIRIKKQKEYRKDYYTKNKEKFLERYYQNKEKILERTKEYTKNNKDKIKSRRKIYREKNREEINAKKRKYNQEHKEMKRLWQQKNKDKVNIQKQIRRTNKNNLPSNLNVKQWKEIKIKFNNKCAYCGQELPLSQDHFIPLSKGGEYTVNNIIPSCKSCNCSKNNSDFFEWYHKQEFYSKEREENIIKHLRYREDKQQLRLI